MIAGPGRRNRQPEGCPHFGEMKTRPARLVKPLYPAIFYHIVRDMRGANLAPVLTANGMELGLGTCLFFFNPVACSRLRGQLQDYGLCPPRLPEKHHPVPPCPPFKNTFALYSLGLLGKKRNGQAFHEGKRKTFFSLE